MATWRCLHSRTSPLAGTPFADLASWPSFALVAALETGRPFPVELLALELAARRRKCPGCREQDRRNRNHWAALLFAGIVLGLLRVWGCR